MDLHTELWWQVLPVLSILGAVLSIPLLEALGITWDGGNHKPTRGCMGKVVEHSANEIDHKIARATKNEKQLAEGAKSVDDAEPEPLWGTTKTVVQLAWLGVILTQILCLPTVTLYFYLIAVPAYSTGRWEVTLQYPKTLRPPAFAIAQGSNDAAHAQLSANGPNHCLYPTYNGSCCDPSFPTPLKSRIYGSLQYFVFNPNDMPNGIPFSNSFGKVMLVNSQDIRASYSTPAIQDPYLYYAIFDPEMDFLDAIERQYVALTEISTLGANTLTITEYQVHDNFGLAQKNTPNGYAGKCGRTDY
ncbi:hypothetical protein BZG36_01386 [Bifiguratus adelaidae]|uniref:Uncharacterized protein n=1 Tax=Bifiguratus adelaidae TaxID=1938954 RepID=A0A261Y3C7_9FUNG|nr:hypothetical protein BZG36_01386 [Bifiguratus adelaidae]